jgi:hypothetical protein
VACIKEIKWNKRCPLESIFALKSTNWTSDDATDNAEIGSSMAQSCAEGFIHVNGTVIQCGTARLNDRCIEGVDDGWEKARFP